MISFLLRRPERPALRVQTCSNRSCLAGSIASLAAGAYKRSNLMRWTMPNTCTNRGNLIFLLTCLLTAAGLTRAQAPENFEAGIFSSFEPGENLPAGWQPLNFSGIEKHTNYSLVKENDTVVIKAVSNQSASGLTRAISIDPGKYPFIQWSWKVNNLLQKGDVTRKDGDDYPARVYLTFAFDPD